MISPPQSPGCRDPAGCEEVRTIGACAVPRAMILAPRRMNSEEPTTFWSPTIFVPGSMVSVAPLATWMNPDRVYVVSA
jgi:hypothetical protein